MNEMIKEWLTEMFDEEIKQTEGSIANERMWEKGACDDETQNLHTENIHRFEEYLEVLKGIKAKALATE